MVHNKFGIILYKHTYNEYADNDDDDDKQKKNVVIIFQIWITFYIE